MSLAICRLRREILARAPELAIDDNATGLALGEALFRQSKVLCEELGLPAPSMDGNPYEDQAAILDEILRRDWHSPIKP